MIDFDGACEDYDARPSDSEAADKFRLLGSDQLAESCKAEAQRQAEALSWKASAICATATGLVGGDRERTHGDKLSNFTNIARMWNAILMAKGFDLEVSGSPLNAHDVANMMEAMKIARRYTGTVNRDDYVDGAGYAGVAGEVVQRSSTCSM